MTRPLLIRGGPILTMTAEMPEAEAVLVDAGRIVRVFPARAPLPELPEGARVLDLAGQCLLPGFIDAHTHLFHWGLRRVRPDLSATRSLDEALDLTMARHRALPPGDALIAEGWDESRWSSGSFPSRADLDHAFPDRAVVLRRVCGHMAVANTKALERIPAGPEVDEATGLLVEEASMGLARVFPPTDSELDRALVAGQASYHAMGVTAVHDMTTPDHLRAYRRASRRGALALDITAILTRPHLDVLSLSGLGAGWRRGPVRIWGVKFFSDGSLGARTAALEDPYADDSKKRGLLLLEREEIEAAVRQAEEAGIPLAIHAIGDRAIETVLSGFEAALPAFGSSLGHRIEHLEMPAPRTLERMKLLGLVASMQPNFVALWGHPGGMYEARLGTKRALAMNPFRRVVDSDVLLALGSDAMPAGVLDGLRGTVEAPFPDQRLTVFEALQGATAWAARAAGDRDGGHVAPGCRADFVVLDRNPVTAGDFRGATVRTTIRAGEIVFDAKNPGAAN
jgi:predicted amidohydrolase YtcJ